MLFDQGVNWAIIGKRIAWIERTIIRKQQLRINKHKFLIEKAALKTL